MTSIEDRPAPDDPRKPDSLTDVSGRGFAHVFKRAAKEFRQDNCTDWAASLTYYGVLAMFPAIIAITSLIGLVGNPQTTTANLLKIIDQLGPSSAVDSFAKPVQELAHSHTAGPALVLGLLLALWSASGYVGAFGRAANAIYE